MSERAEKDNPRPAVDRPDDADAALHMTPADKDHATRIAARERDWRCGPIVYQVFVDRFAPPDPGSLERKVARGLYDAPRVLKTWDQPARRGVKLPDHGVMSHEIEFWGGDLASLRTRLDHLERLGVDVLYLNPIHHAWTNHKYDALDWAEISPEYGSRADVASLAEDLEARGIRLVLDGVFNHMGRNAPAFRQAMEDPSSPYRHWFSIGDQYERGYRAWFGAANLPEIRLEHPDVQARVWEDEDSVVRDFLRDGVDGWRLDVAYDYGLTLLAELTAAAHEQKPDAWIVGEVWNYPEAWVAGDPPPLDGVMNMYARRLVIEFLDGKIEGGRMGRMLREMIDDMTIDAALRSWLVLDNHDTPRLKTMLPRAADRRLAQIMQMTLPGAPVVYYGVEAGMDGDRDPEMRGPMDWDAVERGNPELDRLGELLEMRGAHPALRIGDLRVLETDRLLAYQRRTGRAMETVTILVNPAPVAVTELVSLADSKFMNAMPLRDVLRDDPKDAEVWSSTGTIEVTVPARGAMVLVPTDDPSVKGGYSPYKRVW